MNSQENNSFSDILYNMLKDLSSYHRNKNTLLQFYINQRLNDSLKVYYKELSQSIDYLSDKNNIRVLKKLNEQ